MNKLDFLISELNQMAKVFKDQAEHNKSWDDNHMKGIGAGMEIASKKIAELARKYEGYMEEDVDLNGMEDENIA
jgi:hypothetical protein